MFIRRVSGSSMSPAVSAGDIVILRRKKRVYVGDIVLARVAGRQVIKRVSAIDGDFVMLLGDNTYESNDSRHYGKIAMSAILGTVMATLPTAVNPPKLVSRYGYRYGRVAAAILMFFAVVHLFRIDTFIPLLDSYLPGGSLAASWTALGIIASEMFAIPFALRMKLSPLGHIMSGYLMVLAPFWWVLICLWTLGLPGGIGQFGQFLSVPSTLLVLALNTLWLLFSLVALRKLGFESLSLRRQAAA